jgi:hypothetical protein
MTIIIATFTIFQIIKRKLVLIIEEAVLCDIGLCYFSINMIILTQINYVSNQFKPLWMTIIKATLIILQIQKQFFW